MVTYCKYTNKRARKTKLAWIFFTASAEIFEVYLKYNEQTSEKYQARLDIFHCECINIRGLPQI